MTAERKSRRAKKFIKNEVKKKIFDKKSTTIYRLIGKRYENYGTSMWKILTGGNFYFMIKMFLFLILKLPILLFRLECVKR